MGIIDLPAKAHDAYFSSLIECLHNIEKLDTGQNLDLNVLLCDLNDSLPSLQKVLRDTLLSHYRKMENLHDKHRMILLSFSFRISIFLESINQGALLKPSITQPGCITQATTISS